MASSPTRAQQRWPSAATAPPPAAGDLLQLLTFDLSPLEKRFEQVFARLDALERANDSSSSSSSSSSSDAGAPAVAATEGEPLVSFSSSSSFSSAAASAHGVRDVDVARALESLHAAQLRLQIDHELAQATFKVETEALRRELLALPQLADLHHFRAEIGVQLTATAAALGDQQLLLWQDVERSLAARELSENQWKAQFDAGMTARLADVWAALEAARRAVDASVASLQTDVVAVEATARETADGVERMRVTQRELERRAAAQEEETVVQGHAVAQLRALARQASLDLATQDAEQQAAVAAVAARLDAAQAEHTQERVAYEAFVADVERTLSFCTNEISSTIHAALQRHGDALLALDRAAAAHTKELRACEDALRKHDARLGSLDGRLVQQEKQALALARLVQDQHFDTGKQVGDVRKALDHALQDRAAIKRAAAELGLTVQEQQQSLQEVGKLAATTELSLARAAAEVAKLHALASTNTATITRTRQTLADVGQLQAEERAFARQLHAALEHESQLGAARLADAVRRDEAARLELAAAHDAVRATRAALDERITHNGNLLHQLHAAVDALAVTESATDMDDKLARLALQTAELGLKLELLAASAGSCDAATKHEVRGELAVVLARVVRFLGAGVAIDQNKYFLSTARLAAPDAASRAAVVELPAVRALEQLRAAKVALFVARTRAWLEQLRPVARSVRDVHAWRDLWGRQVAFVVAFGLANLFANVARPRHPLRRNPLAGTCIACDRPLDQRDDDDDDDACGGGDASEPPLFSRLVATATADPEVEAVEETKLRRNKLVVAATAGVTRKIDTRTPVKGRSGGLPRPRSAAPTSDGGSGHIHHAPGTGEYVYRAGFRLPRPSTAGGGKSASAAELAAVRGLVVAAGPPPPPPQQHEEDGVSGGGDERTTLDDTVSACLEKVALVGRHSIVAGEVPTLPLAAAARPHTAPLRSRSLPRLEATAEPPATGR